MKLTTENKTIEVDEQKLLGMIRNNNVARLECVVMRFYEVSKYEALPQRAKDAVIYLCIIALDLKRSTVRELYELTDSELTTIGKRVDEKVRNDEEKDYLYALYSRYTAAHTIGKSFVEHRSKSA